MILLPGSFSGNMISAKPHRGPDPRSLISFPIFIKLQAIVFKAPDTSTIESCAARASNLFGAVTNGRPVKRKYFVTYRMSKKNVEKYHVQKDTYYT